MQYDIIFFYVKADKHNKNRILDISFKAFNCLDAEVVWLMKNLICIQC